MTAASAIARLHASPKLNARKEIRKIVVRRQHDVDMNAP